MASSTHTNGSTKPLNGSNGADTTVQDELLQLNLELKNLKHEGTYAKFHGDDLIGVSCDEGSERITPLTRHAGQTRGKGIRCEFQELHR